MRSTSITKVWNAADPAGANAKSPSVRVDGFDTHTLVGTNTTATVITFEVSMDGSTWVTAGAGTASGTSHYLTLIASAVFIRLSTSADISGANFWIMSSG